MEVAGSIGSIRQPVGFWHGLFALEVLLVVGYPVVFLVNRATPELPGIGLITGLSNLDNESSFATLFSVLQLGAVSTLAALLWRNARFFERSERRGWTILTLTFVAMTIDEDLSFHELLIEPVKSALHLGEVGPFHFAWVIPGALVVLVLGFVLRSFIGALASGVRNRLTLGFALFLLGAIGGEMVGGTIDGSIGRENFYYVLAVMGEEGLEIAGVTVIALGLIIELRKYPGLFAKLIEKPGAWPGSSGGRTLM